MLTPKRWFDFVGSVTLGEKPIALSLCASSSLADKTFTPFNTPVPKARLPHVAPREALIEAYVMHPRHLKPIKSTEPSSQEFMPQKSVSRSSLQNAAPEERAMVAKTKQIERGQTDTRSLAQSAQSLEELKAIVTSFEGCPLKVLATHTVFGDGNPTAPVMFIGEAPGAEEDARGLPFVGLSGQLLDRMMKAAGLDRTCAYITNILPWRPPGNRQPSPQEVAQCLPFVERHIELVNPKVLVFVGGTAVKALLARTDGIMRLRGQWLPYVTPHMREASLPPIRSLATFHPAYLLRSPGQKREAWKDFLAIQQVLRDIGASG